MSVAEQWAVYFRYMTDRSKRRKIDEAERTRLMSGYKYVADTQSKVARAKREGREEGRREIAAL